MKERTAATKADASKLEKKSATPRARPLSGLNQLSAMVSSPGHSGVPIPAALRAPAETIAGRSLAHARLHSGERAGSIVNALGARALNVGRHVVAGPEVAQNPGVLTHELLHVAQSRGEATPGGLTMGQAGDRYEQDVHRAMEGGQVVERRSASRVQAVWPRAEREMANRPSYASRVAAAEALRARWEAAYERRWNRDLQRQGGGIGADLQQSQGLVMATRMAAVQAASAQGFPADLAERWAQAKLATIQVETALDAPAISGHIADTARGDLAAFYWAMVRAAQVWESDERARHRRAQAELDRVHPYQDPTIELLAPPVPDPISPQVLAWAQTVGETQGAAGWRSALHTFAQATAALDRIVVRVLPSSSVERQQFRYASARAERLEAFGEAHPQAVRIPAVFYPEDRFQEAAEGEGEAQPVSMPWSFYLVYPAHTEGGEWELYDLTAGRPVPPVNRMAGERERDSGDPPLALFDALNSRLRFPKGRLFFRLPTQRGEHARRGVTLRTTAPLEWSDWLTYLGLGAAGVGLMLLTAGAATPLVAGAFITGSALGVGSTLAGWAERSEHGMLTSGDVARGTLMIAADIAGSLALGAGTIVKAAAVGGRAATLAGRVFVPLTRTAVVADLVNLAVMTHDFVGNFQALAGQPGLSDEARSQGLARLVLTGMLTGGLTMLSVRGGVADLRGARSLRLDIDPGTGQHRLMPDLAEVGPPGMRVDPNEVQVRGMDPSLGSGDVIVDVQRGRLGQVDAVGLRWGPDVSLRDIELHLAVARAARSYAGLLGRIRELLEQFAARFGGRPNPPLTLRLELWKLEHAVSRRFEDLRSGVSDARAADLEAEIASLSRRAERVRAAFDDVSLRAEFPENQVAVTFAEAGLPPVPAGHLPELRGGRWQLTPRADHTGPHLDYEYDAVGRVVGVSNSAALARSGVLGRPLDGTSAAQLRSLGYQVEGDQILGTVRAQLLRVDPETGTIQIHHEAVHGPRPLWDVELDQALPGRITIDPTLASRIRFPGAPDLVYIVRRGGEILKVGKTTSAQAGARFGVYRRAGERLEWDLQIEVIPVSPRSGQTVEGVEADLRSRFSEEPMPWDNTSGRLGRGGPGTPWDSFRRTGRWEGWGWSDDGRFIPVSEGARMPEPRVQIPSRAEVHDLLTRTRGSVAEAAELAREGGVSQTTIRRWLRLYGLDLATYRGGPQ